MTAATLLNSIYEAYRGKISSRTPAWGTDKANLAISIANRKQREWCTDPRNKWNSLFEIRAVSPVLDVTTTPTYTYNLATDFHLPSDFARIVKTDDSIVEYPIVKAQQRNVESQSLYIHGTNPKKITFAQTVDTGLEGGTLYVPGYYLLADLSLSTDVVKVDDPFWLVYATAAELARNDPSKEDNYSNLVGQANELYTRMSNANNDSGFLQPNSIVTNMPQVSIGTDDWTA